MKSLLSVFLCGLAMAASAQSLKVQDISLYDAEFLAELEEQAQLMGSMELQGNMLILEQTDTIHFPEAPAMGIVYVLEGEQDGLKIRLEVERKNYSTVSFNIDLENDDYRHQQSGVAHISSSFFMGSESDESSFSGISYFAAEYTVYEEECAVHIRLGHEEESGPELLGKIISSCTGELPNISLDSFPTMKAQQP